MAQESLTPAGEVTAATVFQDRASVTRTLTVDLQAGENDVVFSGLPSNVDVYTLQASGSGDAVIRGLSVERVELANDRRARVDELNDQIAAKLDARQALQDDVTAAEAELAFVRGVSAAAAGQLSSELMFVSDTTQDADALAALVRTRVDAALESVRVARIGMRDLDADVAALRRELSRVQGAPQWARYDVTVTVGAAQDGAGSVDLIYTVPGAGWTPSWDARADLDTGELTMSLSATVRQTTGEDWSGVALTLSTAQPAQGVMAPELQPFWLAEPSYSYGYGDMDDGVMMDAEESLYEIATAPAPAMERMAEPEPAPMLIQQAEVVERAVASTFEVPGQTRIDGDGTSRRVQVTQVEVPSTWLHVAVPSLDERAWRVAEATWPEGWSLLAGQVRVFADDSYVGSMNLPGVGQGSTFELGFGPDEGVRLERTLVEDLQRSAGFLRKPSLTRTWRDVVTNGRSEPVQVSLRDRVPVPTQDAWKVRAEGDEPTTLEDEGLVRWDVELAPSDTLSVAHGWTVRWPKRNPPGGL